MSIYSDYKNMALTDDEFRSLCQWENAKDNYDVYLEAQEYYTDDDIEEENEDEVSD